VGNKKTSNSFNEMDITLELDGYGFAGRDQDLSNEQKPKIFLTKTGPNLRSSEGRPEV
jgi:hypothetical protein